MMSSKMLVFFDFNRYRVTKVVEYPVEIRLGARIQDLSFRWGQRKGN